MGRRRTTRAALRAVKESWDLPSATAEARSLLLLAQRLGSVELVRNSISLDLKQAAELRRWTVREPWLTEKIENLIRFRRQVLREFDRLARGD